MDVGVPRCWNGSPVLVSAALVDLRRGGQTTLSASQINGLISNTGHSVIFTVENETRHHINITGGPLSYKYQFHEIHIHYGLHDQFGSEHAINGYSFPAELGDLSNPELRILTEELENIKYGGAEMPVNRLSVRGLLPDTDYYMTYDGSTTAPACYETVTWIIINKPIYITKQQVTAEC
ncbi:jg8516 [Pararge aegeria aegeria]|uniref:Jg8516 protein n=1 Tax=Pararge aegeria aegeria TaxID=348720 RepID=A0A8S4R9R9_9NEOP|nr:jg8516 [Pararge aegeria aegeria]